MEAALDFEALLDSTADTLIVLDEEGRVSYANAATERLGYSPASLHGETPFNYIHPDDRKAVLDTFQSVVESDEPCVEVTEVFRFELPNGGWSHLEARMTNKPIGNGTGYVVSVRDVTDRVRAERERNATAQLLEEIATKTSEALWVFNADWTEIRFVNDAVEDIYGITPEALEKDPTAFLDCIHPDDRAEVKEAMAKLSAGEPMELEYRVNEADDYGIWVWAQGEPVVKNGEVEQIVGFSRDITDRRERERQLTVMDTLLRHNIRNHVNLVEGYADRIESETEVREVAERADDIGTAARSLLKSAEKQRRVIEVLTDPGKPSRIDLSAAIDHAIEVVGTDHPDVDIQVTVPSGLFVQALDDIEQALRELLENAMVHTKGEPTVEVTADRTDGTIRVVIQDSGPPIPLEETRVLTGQTELDELRHTSGVGLWLVYWTVERSNGDIHFEVTDDGGNRVTVELPAAT